MQKALAAYNEGQTSAWTRIDMLLALYDGTRRALLQLANALEDPERKAEVGPLRLRASKLVLGIDQGLDMQYGELPHAIAQLCQFIGTCIWNDDPSGVRQSEQLLATVAEGYQQIRDEAAELERTGQIPPPRTSSAWQRVV